MTAGQRRLAGDFTHVSHNLRVERAQRPALQIAHAVGEPRPGPGALDDGQGGRVVHLAEIQTEKERMAHCHPKGRTGSVSSAVAAMASAANTLPVASTNSHSYSVANQRGPIA